MATNKSDGSWGSLAILDNRKRNYSHTMECSCREIEKRDVNSNGRRIPPRIKTDTVPSSLSLLFERRGMKRKRRFRGMVSFYGVLWLVSVSLLPLACTQPTAAQPTTAASRQPTLAASPTSESPVGLGTISPLPTPQPVMVPSLTPAGSPTEPPQPTVSPVETQQPSLSPTAKPTATPRPTGIPSASPSDLPSVQPSSSPTAEPTFRTESFARTVFNQRFQIGNQQEFNATEQGWFCENMAGYTDDFGGRLDRVNTTCRVLSQSLQIIGNRQLREGLHNGRRLQGVVFNQVDYGMTYRSNHTNVTSYPTLFQNYVNEDLDRLTTDLQNAGLAVTNSFLAFNNIATLVPTTIPTITPRPTMMPSIQTPEPTIMPSAPFVRPPNVPDETAVPTIPWTPTPPPEPEGLNQPTIIAVSLIAVLSAVMMGLFVFYRQRKKANERKFQAQAAAAGAVTGESEWNSRSDMRIDTGQPFGSHKNGSTGMVGVLETADSLRSKDSLISAGPSALSDGSEREEDGTHNLADEFDQYKDQNLEKMRTGVEDNLTGFDGMMSQALTKAIMSDDDVEFIDMNELRWGGSGDSIEIEATALFEVTDWVKRKEGATMQEKGAFMQETLDRMVGSVRHGVMDPECGSRAIHECAALLGLQLASNIPGNTLIVSGMPKWVQRNDLLSAFSEFGEIEAAAVAANRRGFGLVRFKSLKAVSAAMSKFRTGEIVVQDVAVMIKVLKTDDSDRRSGGWPESGFPAPVQNLSRHPSRAASPVLK